MNPRCSDTNAPFPDKGNLDSPSHLCSTSNYITRTQSPVDLSTISTERQTAFKSSDTATSSLIGTTTERQRIQREIQNLYVESLIADQEKDEKQDRIERSLSIQQIRKNRVPQEPGIQEDHIVTSIRHPALATRRRIFRGDAKMNNVYEWVESLSPEPMFFKFFCNNTAAIPPSDAASKYALTTLNMEEVDEPLYFEDDDKEITVKGFQGADNQNVFSLNSRRLQEKEKLKLDYNIAPFTVDRHNVFNDLMKIYEDERVTSRCISVNFKGEDAYGEGVTRDVFSEFFKFVFRFKSAGISSCVPSSLSEEESVKFGKILTHYFVQFNMFPTCFSKTVLEYIIFDEVRKETLQESFYNYISPYEKNIIQQCLQKKSFDNEIVQGLCDIFSDCGITNLPSPSNIQAMILDAGKKVFIQKPFFVLKNIKIGLGEFWKVVTVTEIDNIWNLEAPTPTDVLKNINFSGMKTRSD